MGWKLDCVGTPLDGRPLDETVAAVLGTKVGLTEARPDNLFCPAKGLWAVSAADRAWLFGDTMFDDFVSRRVNPQKEMAGFVLHSVVDAYGFALWRDGAFVRRRFGAAPTKSVAQSVVFDDGEPLPAEIEAARCEGAANPDIGSAEIAEAIWRDPRTIDEPADHSMFGEPVVFAMLHALCGVEDEGAFFEMIDSAPSYRVDKKGLLSRLFPAAG